MRNGKAERWRKLSIRYQWVKTLFMIAGFGLAMGWQANALSAPAGSVWVTELDEQVTASLVAKVIDDFSAAEEASAGLILLRIDTPGGFMEPTRVLIQAILDSSVPVVGYVAPAGARSSSAGTFILMATHIAAMSPATNMGSATPVFLGFGDVDETMKTKVVNDAAAQIRALAQLRSRNADWLETSVTESQNITATEALALGVIDLVAVNQSDLLKQLDQRTIDMDGAPLTLETAQLETIQSKPFESVSWPTLWLLVGLVLIGLELLLTSFISLFFGLGALVTAAALTLGLPSSGWPVWVVFLGSSLGFLFGMRARFKDYFVGDEVESGKSELDEGYIGQRVSRVSGFDAAQSDVGMVEFRGSHWQARSERPCSSPTAQFVIQRVESNTLIVQEISNE
jgi:membrane-bound ClpP family serine protease